MIIRSSAYPRAALVGNPSDGYFGKTIAFVFDNYQAQVQLYETPELKFLPSTRDYTEFKNLEDLDNKVDTYGYYGGIRLLKAAARQFYHYCKKHGASPEKSNFTIRYESDIPNRLGLAGSSAIITAAMRAMFKYYDLQISNAELANLVLATERDELSIPAGLQDRVAQAFNHPVFMDFNRDLMEERGYGDYRCIDIPSGINLFVGYRTDLAEGSEILHSRLRSDYNAKVPAVLDAMEEWAELTEKMTSALQQRDHSAIARIIDRNFDLRCEVCASSISEKNMRMVTLARECGASAKFTGSGGAIIGTFEDDAMFERLQTTLKQYDVEIIRPRIVTNGVNSVCPEQ
ncbi:MAG: GHMP kinase [Lentisphaeria bacterium]|nr:GHMP kinase [Lentisphaeria bacterium]